MGVNTSGEKEWYVTKSSPVVTPAVRNKNTTNGKVTGFLVYN